MVTISSIEVSTLCYKLNTIIASNEATHFHCHLYH